MILRSLLALAVLSLLAGSPLADDSNGKRDARQILDRAKAAQGGEAWDSRSGVHVVGTVETGGLSGKFESVQDLRKGLYCDKWQLGPMKGGSGFDGKEAWTEDGSGVARVEGAEASRQGMLSDAYRRANGWWYPERFAAELTVLPERREGERSFEVLRITPLGGRPFELWVGEDGRFDRWIEAEGGVVLTTFLTDWREVGGVLLPFSQRVTRGEAEKQYDQTLRLEEVTFQEAPGAAAFALPSPPPPDYGFLGGKKRTTVPFEIVNGHIYLDVKLEGKGPFRLIVDTGAVNIVTPALAKALGLTSQGQLPGGGVGEKSEDMGIVTVKELMVGDAWVKDQTFLVFALDRMNPIEGVKEYGIIGYEVFRRFAAKIDYEAQRLTLFSPDAFQYQGEGAVIPFVFNEHIPQVDGEIDGIPGKFDLDTGSRSSLDLMAPFVLEHGLVARYGATTERIGGWGAGGPAKSYMVRAGELKLGPFVVAGPVTGLSVQKRGAFAATEVAGNVGYGVLSRFTVYLDYAHQKVVLEKNSRFGHRDLYDRAGLWLHLGDSSFLVVEAVPGTPASEAGLEAGDEILTVDGKTPRTLTLFQLRTLLRESPVGTRVFLRVKRADRVHKVRLVLRDLI